MLGPVVSLAGGSFFIDDTTSYVGIGNTTPAARLDVAGAMYSRMITATSSSINWNAGNVQSMTLSSDPILTFSNGQAGGKYDLILNQDATGGRVVTWPGSVIWSGGSEPVLTTSASSTDILSFIYDGARYLGSVKSNYSIQGPSIAFDNSTSTLNLGSGLSLSATETVGVGSNKFLLSFYDDGNSDLYDTSSYNGTTMTRYNSVWPGINYSRINGLYLYAPNSGTNQTLTASDTTGGGAGFLHGVSYTGVKQSGFPDAVCTNSSTTGSISCTINTSTPGTWMVMHVTASNGTLTAGTNATLRTQPRGDTITVDSNGPIPTGGYTMTVNNSISSGQYLGAVAFTLAPAN